MGSVGQRTGAGFKNNEDLNRSRGSTSQMGGNTNMGKINFEGYQTPKRVGADHGSSMRSTSRSRTNSCLPSKRDMTPQQKNHQKEWLGMLRAHRTINSDIVVGDEQGYAPKTFGLFIKGISGISK
jgi:hypothetical protein